MKLFLAIVGAFFLMAADCHKKNDTPNELIKIEGFIITDALGNQIGLVGNAGSDWQVLDWSQLTATEQSFLNFPDNVNLTNTVVASLNAPIAFPSPFNDQSSIIFFAADSVKVKLVVVNAAGQVLKTEAFKMKGNQTVHLDYSDNNLYPTGKSLRYYFSYSAASQQNFKAGYGDVKVCKPSPIPYSQCF